MKYLFLSLAFIFAIGCKHVQSKANDSIRPAPITEIPLQESETLNNWMTVINSKDPNALSKIYDPKAIKITESDEILNSTPALVNYYKEQSPKITKIKSLFSVLANNARGLQYELVKYYTDDHKEHTQLVIWKAQGNEAIRVFEFTGESDGQSSKVDTSEIGARRKSWIALCNLNNPKKLVEQLYCPHTMYFNHKPIVKGTKELVNEYSYMKDENYMLNLTPSIVEAVNVNLVFEIGQCSGSYNGKYILVWKKHADGIWRVHIDSNI